jgi:hypothetical protein
LAGPGLLADTIVKRWQDHLPLHRLEDIYARDGIELARSTVCGWHAELAALVKPLVAAMRADAFEQPYLCVDATGVLVQHAERCRTGHFWVVVAPERHVLFEYTPEHTGDAVDDVLAGYRGYLVADAHTVYDHLYEDGALVEVNCWGALPQILLQSALVGSGACKIALGLIGALFRIERTLANSPRKKKEQIRRKRSGPIVDRFFSWCDAEAAAVLDNTPISDGIRYARNQRVGLTRFLEDGRCRFTTTGASSSYAVRLLVKRTGSSSATTTLAPSTQRLPRSSLARGSVTSSRGRTCETSSACSRPGPNTACSNSPQSPGRPRDVRSLLESHPLRLTSAPIADPAGTQFVERIPRTTRAG